MTARVPPDNPTPERREVLISDAERERGMAHLNTAVGEGRLTLEEFTERVDGLLRARTYREMEKCLDGLPALPDGMPSPPDVLELRASMSPVRRQGRWTVPRRLVVQNNMSNMKLDFTEASISHPIVEVDVDVSFGKTCLVLPAGATANTDGIEVTGSKIRRSGIELEPQPGSGPHIVVTGTQRFGKLVIRRQRRFLRWRW